MAGTSRPERVIRLIRPTSLDGVGAFSVRAGGKTTFYALHEIRCDIGGRGFEVHRLGLGQLYHVRVGEPDDCSCECLGFLRHGHCRHVLGLLALVKRGLL
jgi:hypothetical protein